MARSGNERDEHKDTSGQSPHERATAPASWIVKSSG